MPGAPVRESGGGGARSHAARERRETPLRARYVVGGVLLAGATYFALFGGEYSLLELARIRRERGLEAERLGALRAEVESRAAYTDSLENDPATIERMARERWGLIKPGERLYRFDESAPDSTRMAPPDSTAASRRE